MSKKIIKKPKSKPKSRNLVLPILGVSLFTMLGFTVYFNLPRPTPLQVAEVTTPASNCASVAFTDNFAGTTLNTTKWSAYSNTSGTATLDNKLTLFQPAGTALALGESNILTEGKVDIDGDFVQEVTLQSLTTTPETNNLASFLLGLAAPGWKNWYRIEIYKNGDIQTYSNTNDVVTRMTPVNVFQNTPTKLKMVRSGSTLTTYYDVGTGYVLHSTVPNIYTGKVFVQLDLLSHAPDKPAVTAVVKNFSLKCRPPLPSGLSHTCSADGKTVSLKWDDNSPSKNYYFALNDTVENSEKSWYKSGTTDVWRGGNYDKNTYVLPVVPGHKYDWWLQTSAGDYTDPGDASSESLKSFTCTPKIAAPLNLRVSCNPDGKSARLMWDGVVDAESYKIRLDDKNGKVTNYDNLKEAQYIATVTPDKMYSFWAHSHKGGLDSNQSTAIDFTCKVTATPTPTPRSTAKPTSTPISKGDEVTMDDPEPTVSPTVKPTTTPRPPTNPTYVEPTPTASPIATKSTNPVSRFFSWLAGLFE